MYLKNDGQGCVNSEILYTEDFFKELEAMIDKRPHFCRGCGVMDRERQYLKNGSQRKIPAKVRLCLIDEHGPPNEAINVGMFCLSCRKPDPAWRTPAEPEPSELPQINFPDPEWELGPGASATRSLGEVDGATCNDLLVLFEEPLTEKTELVRNEERDYARICTE